MKRILGVRNNVGSSLNSIMSTDFRVQRVNRALILFLPISTCGENSFYSLDLRFFILKTGFGPDALPPLREL